MSPVTRQRVSTWVPTGSRTFCPVCGHPDVVVAYFVYSDGHYGWRYSCEVCGAQGEAERKERS